MSTLDLSENYQQTIINEVNSTMKIFQFSRKQKNKQQKIFPDYQSIFESGPRLAIIKPCFNNQELNLDKNQNENQNQDQISQNNNKNLVVRILNALSQLSDNQQKNKIIKSFFSVPTTYTKYERMKYIEKHIPNDLIQYLKQEYCMDIFKQLNDSYKMQLEQQIQNILFFEASQKSENISTINYNSAFLASYLMYVCSQKLQQNSTKYRLIFLNLTGIKNNDEKLYQLFSKDECLYIQLQKIPIFQNQSENGLMNLNKTNFKIINIEENIDELTWKQFRIIYKYQIKKQITNFKSNLFILSIAKQFNNQNYINFSEDCIKNMIEKFSYLAKDKLIIHSYIRQDVQSNEQFQQQYALSNEQLQQKQLRTYINSLQQGILSQEVLLHDNIKMEMESIKLDFWIQNLIQKNKNEINVEQQELIQRERRNKMLNSQYQLVKDSTKFKHGIYIIKDIQQQYREIIYLFYENQNIQFFTNTILYVDYVGKQIVLLKYENQNYFLYYTKFQIQNSDEEYEEDLNCERINLSEILLKQNIILDESIILNSSLIVNNQKIYIIYTKNASNILMINLENTSVVILERKNQKIDENKHMDNKFRRIYTQTQEYAQKQIQDRRKPTIVYNPCVTGFDFIIFGGEIVNSNKFCNIIELLKVESEGFSSVVIPKDILYQKCNYYIPWPNMIVLVNNQQPRQYILLPGDYHNKACYYNQVINKEHQEKAILISSHQDSLQFQIDYLNIVYSNDENKKILPIQYFSGNYRNIKNPKDLQCQWYLAITLLDNSSPKIIQLFIQAEIEILIKQKELSIKQSFKEIEYNMELNKQIITQDEFSSISTKYNQSILINQNFEEPMNQKNNQQY